MLERDAEAVKTVKIERIVSMRERQKWREMRISRRRVLQRYRVGDTERKEEIKKRQRVDDRVSRYRQREME